MTRDTIDPRTAGAVAAFLDLPVEQYTAGAPLPLMWHLFYFLSYPAQAQIAADGHPAGSAAPEGTRRMFAGGRVETHRGLRVGDDAVVTGRVTDERTREGRSGPMRFVTHRSEITVGEDLALIDERDIVYLPLRPEQSGAAERPKPHPAEPMSPAVAHRRVTVDPTLLFRFSALTYNAHRIHYDRDYAREVEGYPALVVHGPLQVLLMAELARQTRPEPARGCSYRLSAPLFEHSGLVVSLHETAGELQGSIHDDAGTKTASCTFVY